MSNTLQKVFSAYLIIGLALAATNPFYSEYLNDFWNGFFKGAYFVLLLAGLYYLGWCLKNKKTPFRFKEN